MITNKFDIIIIGAGASGLFNANLLNRRGFKVLVLESHFAVGGCAGFFRRGKLQFDVGATTVSGLGQNQPLGKLFNEIGFKHSFYKQENLQISHPSKLNFKDLYNLNFWNEIKENENRIWEMSWLSSHYPPKSAGDFFKLANLKNIKFLKDFKNLLVPFSQYLKKLNLDQSWHEILDELLLISCQSKSQQAPTLMAMMALNYLDDLWYPNGGMGCLMEELAKHYKNNLGELKLNSKVINISKLNSTFIIQTQKELYESDAVISTIPIWNLSKLTNLDIRTKSSIEKFPPKWGARVGYFKIKFKTHPIHSYWQIHFKDANLASNSVFVSLPKEELNQEYLPLTVSTHVAIEEFHNGPEKRETWKKYWEEKFLQILLEEFKDNILDIQIVGSGDPKTFEHYTSRFQGSVGGIPQDISIPSYTFPQRYTPEKGFLLAGDTVFPGQGMPGLALGAFGIEQAINQLFKSK